MLFLQKSLCYYKYSKRNESPYIKFFGTQERGRVGYNKIVKIRILEKFIDNNEDMPKLVALGSLNENIDLNIRDKNNNYLVAEIDIEILYMAD